MFRLTKNSPSPKSGIFNITTETLQGRYAEALMADASESADDARTLGIQLGMSVDQIQSDIRDAVLVKRHLKGVDEAVKEADAAEAQRPKLQKALDDAKAAMKRAEEKYLADKNKVMALTRFIVAAHAARQKVKEAEAAFPRLFGRTARGDEKLPHWAA